MMAYQVMTNSRWLQIVADNAEQLRQLVGSYHPSARWPKAEMLITAPNAEIACENIRLEIAKKEPANPLERWDKAIASNNIDEINSLLSAAWFGVPESTECWQIPGFGIACDLMDDLPEQESTDGEAWSGGFADNH